MMFVDGGTSIGLTHVSLDDGCCRLHGTRRRPQIASIL